MGQVVAFKPKQRNEPAKLRCVGCGATVNAACDCNMDYKPAKEVIKAALAKPENKNKPNRKLAKELKVHHTTIGRIRGAKAPSTRTKKQKERKHPIEVEVNFDELEDTYEALLNLFKKVVKRFRHLPNNVIEEALANALKQIPRRTKS